MINGLDFQPGAEARRAIAATRKHPYAAGHLTLPGLFSTTGETGDFVLVAVGLVLEAAGLLCLTAIGGAHVATAGVGFFVDVVFAFLHHHVRRGNTIMKNQALVTIDCNERGRLEYKMRNNDRWARLFAVLLVAIAAIKTVGFFTLNGAAFDLFTVGVLVSYAVVALIHIFRTGYVFAALIARYHINRDRRKFLNSYQPGLQTDHQIVACKTVQFGPVSGVVEAKADNHKLLVFSGVDGKRTARLVTKGILEDRHVVSLIHQQPTAEAKQCVGLAGVRAQLNILDVPGMQDVSDGRGDADPGPEVPESPSPNPNGAPRHRDRPNADRVASAIVDQAGGQATPKAESAAPKRIERETRRTKGRRRKNPSLKNKGPARAARILALSFLCAFAFSGSVTAAPLSIELIFTGKIASGKLPPELVALLASGLDGSRHQLEAIRIVRSDLDQQDDVAIRRSWAEALYRAPITADRLTKSLGKLEAELLREAPGALDAQGESLTAASDYCREGVLLLIANPDEVPATVRNVAQAVSANPSELLAELDDALDQDPPVGTCIVYDGSAKKQKRRRAQEPTSRAPRPPADNAATSRTPSFATAPPEEVFGDRVFLKETIYFDLNSKEITTAAHVKLTGLVEILKDETSRFAVHIRGFACSSGSKRVSQELSWERAQRAASFLAGHLGPISIDFVGVGDAQPMTDNSTPLKRALNRRAEVYVLEKFSRTAGSKN